MLLVRSLASWSIVSEWLQGGRHGIRRLRLLGWIDRYLLWWGDDPRVGIVEYSLHERGQGLTGDNVVAMNAGLHEALPVAYGGPVST